MRSLRSAVSKGIPKILDRSSFVIGGHRLAVGLWSLTCPCPNIPQVRDLLPNLPGFYQPVPQDPVFALLTRQGSILFERTHGHTIVQVIPGIKEDYLVLHFVLESSKIPSFKTTLFEISYPLEGEFFPLRAQKVGRLETLPDMGSLEQWLVEVFWASRTQKILQRMIELG